ncbi:MAG: PHP domain-containing protein, partial [Candidatus Anstonellales archaeon]
MQLKEALDVLEEIAFFLELKGENVFKINAFHNAVRNLSRYDISLKEAFDKEIIQNTKGVGKSIQSVLEELLKKGESSLLIELKKDFPEGILELTRIRGLGAKKIKKLYEELNISSIDELEQACIENKLLKIAGFGEKTQNSILENIKKIKDYQGKLLLHYADEIAQLILEEARKTGLKKISTTGQLRLRSKVISSLEFLIVDEKSLDKFLKKYNSIKENENTYRCVIDNSELKFFITSNEFFVYDLFKTTGTDNFLKRISFHTLSKKSFQSEEEIFKELGFEFIPPQARENDKLKINKYDFPEEKDLKGLIHIHSNYSDGSNTIKEILDFAEKNNYEYVLLCDHSKSAFYANGLDEVRLRQQWEEIDEINSKSRNVKILKGIECDILPDGSLDFDDKILNQFDCVIASVHSRFKMTKDEMTKRISKALKNKYVKILGHPTGRLLLSRDAYPLDIDEIINVASNENKSIELNCNPHRLDLDWEFHQKAKSKGIKITISPDAH